MLGFIKFRIYTRNKLLNICRLIPVLNALNRSKLKSKFLVRNCNYCFPKLQVCDPCPQSLFNPALFRTYMKTGINQFFTNKPLSA